MVRLSAIKSEKYEWEGTLVSNSNVKRGQRLAQNADPKGTTACALLLWSTPAMSGWVPHPIHADRHITAQACRPGLSHDRIFGMITRRAFCGWVGAAVSVATSDFSGMKAKAVPNLEFDIGTPLSGWEDFGKFNAEIWAGPVPHVDSKISPWGRDHLLLATVPMASFSLTYETMLAPKYQVYGLPGFGAHEKKSVAEMQGETVIDRDGKATFFRLVCERTGSVLFQGTVGVADPAKPQPDLTLNTTTLVTNNTFSLSQLSITVQP